MQFIFHTLRHTLLLHPQRLVSQRCLELAHRLQVHRSCLRIHHLPPRLLARDDARLARDCRQIYKVSDDLRHDDCGVGAVRLDVTNDVLCRRASHELFGKIFLQHRQNIAGYLSDLRPGDMIRNEAPDHTGKLAVVRMQRNVTEQAALDWNAAVAAGRESPYRVHFWIRVLHGIFLFKSLIHCLGLHARSMPAFYMRSRGRSQIRAILPISGSFLAGMSGSAAVGMLLDGIGLTMISIALSCFLALLSALGTTDSWFSLGPERVPVTVLTLAVAVVLKAHTSATAKHPLAFLGALLVAVYVRCLISSAIHVGCAAKGTSISLGCRVLFYL